MKAWVTATLAAGLAWSGGARAERDFCANRPGEGTPACTVDVGTLQIETSAVDYSHKRDSEEVEGQTLFGQSVLRYGIADHADLEIGWTPYGIDRDRERGTDMVAHRRGVGDVSLGIRRNIMHPDGSGIAFAVQPFVTLPVGRTPIGAGTWSAGLLAPVTAVLDDEWSLTIDPEVDAAADQDGDGRHLAYSGVLNIDRKLGQSWQATVEAFVQRDRDPAEPATLAMADFAIARQFGEDGQVDVSLYRGLNRQTPRYELILGFVRRFR